MFAGHLGQAGAPRSPGTTSALELSVLTATITTMLAAGLGVPLAYLLARHRGRLAAVAGALVALPLALPPLMSGILLLAVLGPYTLLGRLTGGRLTDDLAGIVAAQLFVAAPFLVLAARSAFRALDPALEEIAATLGHGPWSRFHRVALRAALPGIGAGLLLTWLRAFGEFGATVLVAYHPYSLPVLAFVAFSSSGLAATARPVLAALAVATLLPAAAAIGVRVLRPRSQLERWPMLRRGARRGRQAICSPGRAPLAPVATGRAASSSPAVLPSPHPPQPGPPVPAGEPRPPPVELSVRAHAGSFTVSVELAQAAQHLVLLGASGAGKSTVLRAVAGVLPGAAARTGLLGPDGVELCSRPAERRRIGYLPQDGGLLPGLPVWRQVQFGRGVTAAAAGYWLRRLELLELAHRRPQELSGGQRRRVGLARALASAPALLLLDEPFAGLDAPVRATLRRLLRELQQETGVPTIVVTHDLEDAAALADIVAILDHGKVVQQGPLHQLLDHPATPEVARLLAAENLVADPDRIWAVRPEHVSICSLTVLRASLPAGAGAESQLPATTWSAATLTDSYRGPHGWENLVVLDSGARLVARGGAPPVPVGARCGVRVAAEAVRSWPRPAAPPGDP